MANRREDVWDTLIYNANPRPVKSCDKTIQEETMDITLADLIGKMAIAKHKLERLPKEVHDLTCPSQDDTGHPCPCTCGADKHNSEINDIIALLTIK